MKIILGLFLALYSIGGVYAESIEIGTIEQDPFVMKDAGKLSGFSIELADKIWEKLDLDYKYKEYSVFWEMLWDVEKSKLDMAIANISITSQREKIMDFSHSIFDGGIALMTKEATVKEHINYLWSWKSITIFLGILVLYFVGIKILWKKRKNKKMVIFISILLFCVLHAYFYALFKMDLSNKIQIKDWNIVSWVVWVISKSTSENYVAGYIQKKSYKKLDELYAALEKGEIEAILHDSPVLLYKKMTYAGYKMEYGILQKEKYWIVFPGNSPLKEKVNQALLELKSNGEYEMLYTKYFWKY